MSDVVQNFSQSLLEITIEVLKEKVLIRNYIEESSSKFSNMFVQLVYFKNFEFKVDRCLSKK